MDVELGDQIVHHYTVEDKGIKTVARDLSCSAHRVRTVLRDRGVRIRSQGGDHGGRKNFKGGEYVDSHGYVWVRTTEVPEEWLHGMAHNRYIAKHRLVMARYLGRPLTSREQVHHVDGNKLRNVIENLQLRIKAHGSGAAFHCADCGSCNIVAEEIS